MEDQPEATRPGVKASRAGEGPARIALTVLVLLVVLSPWPFGSVHPIAVQAITIVMLVTDVGVLGALLWRGSLALPAFPLWTLFGLLGFGAFQLVPLPPRLHAVLAPGSYEVWHPSEPAAAAVLGSGWRPVSIFPEATKTWFSFTLGLATLCLLTAPALHDRQRAMRAALVVGAGGLAVAVYGIVARTLFGNLLYGRIAVPTVAPFGPFVSKNHFAGYVEMAALLTLGLAAGLADEARRGSAILGWVQSRRASRVILAYGAALSMGLAVLISLSRGGVVSLAAGSVALFSLRLLLRKTISSHRKVLGAGIVAAAAAASFAVLPANAQQRIWSLVGTTSDESGAFRLGIWRDTLRLIAHSPLVGYGFGAYEDALPRFKTVAGELRVQHAENDYLELAADGGTVALALLAWMVVCVFRRTKLNMQRDPIRRGLGIGAMGALVALAVHSVFDFNLRITSNVLLLSCLAAFTLFAAGSDAPKGSTPACGWLITTTLVIALIMTATRALASEVSPGRNVTAMIFQGMTPLRARRAEAALVSQLRHRPANLEAWIWLGWLRAARGSPAEGQALTRYGTSLEPLRMPHQ